MNEKPWNTDYCLSRVRIAEMMLVRQFQNTPLRQIVAVPRRFIPRDCFGNGFFKRCCLMAAESESLAACPSICGRYGENPQSFFVGFMQNHQSKFWLYTRKERHCQCRPPPSNRENASSLGRRFQKIDVQHPAFDPARCVGATVLQTEQAATVYNGSAPSAI